MKASDAPSFRQRYAGFLLRWAKINHALPRAYATLALDRLRQRGVLGVTEQQLYSVKNSGSMPENPTVTDVLEELAHQYHPEKIRSEKQARAFLRKWEPRKGRKVAAVALVAA